MAIDNKALFQIGYGLYAVMTNDGSKDTGLIVNTVLQVSSNPLRITVTVSKQNYSHDAIMNSKKMNACVLSTDTPFELFEKLGFRSGRDTDKLSNVETWSAENGLPLLTCDYMSAYFSLDVVDTVDFDTHTMFVCAVSQAEVTSDSPAMSYDYYHKNVKPKKATKKKGYVCKICGYVYEGDTLPDDFVCPICKHGATDFEKL